MTASDGQDGRDQQSAAARSPAAPLGRRLGALVYEALLLVAMALVAGFAMLPLVSPGASSGRGDLAIAPPFVRTLMFCMLVGGAALYYAWFWSAGRRTLPQKTWRLCIVDRSGAPLDRKTALLRYAAALAGPAAALTAYAALAPTGHPGFGLLLLAAPYLWALIDRDGQFLHDRLAGTRVIRS